MKSGLRYVRDFIENHSELCNFDGDEGTAFYAQTIPRPGKYFQEWCELKPGESYAYLVGGPIETNYALDKALKQAIPAWQDIGIRRHMRIPVERFLRERNLPAGQRRMHLWKP